MNGVSDGQVTFLTPILAPLSIQSFTLHESGFVTLQKWSFEN